MSDTKSQILSGVHETYLAPLYWKAMESQRPDAMIKDEKAVALVTQKSLDFSGVRQIPMNELLKTMRIIFTCEMEMNEPLSSHTSSVETAQEEWKRVRKVVPPPCLPKNSGLAKVMAPRKSPPNVLKGKCTREMC